MVQHIGSDMDSFAERRKNVGEEQAYKELLVLLMLHAVIHTLFLPQYTCNYYEEPPLELDIFFLFEDKQSKVAVTGRSTTTIRSWSISRETIEARHPYHSLAYIHKMGSWMQRVCQ
jgi:hypothetical protein